VGRPHCPKRAAGPDLQRPRQTGTNKERPGLTEALAACRQGDTLVVTKLDRLPRSLRDVADTTMDLTLREVRMNLRGSICAPTDPFGRLLLIVLGMVVEFESDLIRARTREGMATATVRRKLKGRKPKLSPVPERHTVAVHRAGDHTIAKLVELFGV